MDELAARLWKNYRLETGWGTYYADTLREILVLEGMFRGEGQNVTAQHFVENGSPMPSGQWVPVKGIEIVPERTWADLQKDGHDV